MHKCPIKEQEVRFWQWPHFHYWCVRLVSASSTSTAQSAGYLWIPFSYKLAWVAFQHYIANQQLVESVLVAFDGWYVIASEITHSWEWPVFFPKHIVQTWTLVNNLIYTCARNDLHKHVHACPCSTNTSNHKRLVQDTSLSTYALPTAEKIISP
jgi:hypothetical protein